MSQPRRRRRRGRRRGGGQRPSEPSASTEATTQGIDEPQPAAPKRSRRRRRGRSDRGSAEAASPRSSEDIFRAAPRPQPARVGAPPDERTLEGVIGELQSTWGVPQHPQEYRITLKVASEREARAERLPSVELVTAESPVEPEANGRPRREKAPAAPRIGALSSDAPEEGDAPARRKRSRRRRRRGGGRPSGTQ